MAYLGHKPQTELRGKRFRSRVQKATRGAGLGVLLFAMHTQLSHETSGANRIILCNVIADLLKIERCQGRYQQLH